MAVGRSVGAQEAGPTEPISASSVIAEGLATGRIRLADIPGAYDIARGYAVGAGEPVLAFVASASGATGPSGAVWMDILQSRLEGEASVEAATGTFYMLLFDDGAIDAEPAPGDPLIREFGLRAALADVGVDAVVVLDFSGPPEGLALRAASLGRQSPRSIVAAARRAAVAVGVELYESPVSDFYAAAGMATGSSALGSWLDEGLPAIALDTAGSGARPPEAGAIDTGAFAEAFAAEILAVKNGKVGPAAIRSEDVAYLRYPLPGGSLIVPDTIIISALFIALGTIAVALALGLLKGRRRTASVDAVLKEAGGAFSLAFAALVGARGLAGLARAIAGAALGTDATAAMDGSSWGVALALLIRITCVLCAYYAVSGIAAKLGMHGDHRRIDAARAALALLCADVIVAAVLFPPVVPFLLVAIVVSAIVSGRAVTAAIGLVAVGLVALPFVDPRVVAAIGDASGGAGSVASAMIDAGLAGNAAIAAFVAPFGLWLGAASSPDSHLRRGKRTAFFWLAGALACAAAETLARLA
ncbi:MAG: hypothetical protein CVV47_04755 [Spirochaetae bacterium HGW-Spirochaetae-3]|nr:MAG: hypothetical protein CVV47_04755 [Spirochaetae bacterium HGW-Spirochaetae-3]